MGMEHTHQNGVTHRHSNDVPTHSHTFITVTRSPRGYDATFTGEQEAYVRDLFGTNVIPTAFTPKARIETVLSELQRLNPGALVITD